MSLEPDTPDLSEQGIILNKILEGELTITVTQQGSTGLILKDVGKKAVSIPIFVGMIM
jgi:hypothetical protein